LPLEVNAGYDGIGGEILQSVNGVDVSSLKEVAEALQNPVDGYQVFRLAERNRELVMLKDHVDASADSLQERYRIPVLQRLDYQ